MPLMSRLVDPSDHPEPVIEPGSGKFATALVSHGLLGHTPHGLRSAMSAAAARRVTAESRRYRRGV